MLSAFTLTLLEKAALDNGFDQELPRQADWLGFATTRAPLKLWLTRFGDALYVAAFSQANVAKALEGYGAPATSPLPPGAVAARTVADIDSDRVLAGRAERHPVQTWLGRKLRKRNTASRVERDRTRVSPFERNPHVGLSDDRQGGTLE